MLSRLEIIATARSYLGVKWKHQGRTRNGLDCLGLVVCVAHDLGYKPDVDYTAYQRSPSDRQLLREFDSHFERKLRPEPGDVGVFRDGNYPCHVGIFGWSDRLTLIHGYAHRRCVVEEEFDGEWSEPGRLARVFAFPEVMEWPS